MSDFIGRNDELQALKRLLGKRCASLVIIKGRRCIGKSRLIKEFAKGFPFYNFPGIPPTPGTTSQLQRDEFAR
jgi:AAA+ ATPase superfamily predicted ATPase